MYTESNFSACEPNSIFSSENFGFDGAAGAAVTQTQQQTQTQQGFVQEESNDDFTALNGGQVSARPRSQQQQVHDRNDDRGNITVASSSHVNGQGLWRSWQRSFRSPLDALLDLVDNAVDANHGEGRIRMFTTDSKSEHPDGKMIEGLLMMNSFPKESYKEMHKVLEVFCSQKEQQAIGENGVGVKQASANLSNFNVVLTKMGSRFQIGILSASLQQPEGVVIPSYSLEEGCDWLQEIEQLCEKDDHFRESMMHLGGKFCFLKGTAEAQLETPATLDIETQMQFLADGKERLHELMVYMSQEDGDWGSHECVFGLLLDQLRIDQSADSLLRSLRKDLPKTYLHLTAQTCDILIGNQPLIHQYWERRLVELTYFPIKISRTVGVMNPGTDLENPTHDANILRVFLGFDTNRCSDNQEQSSACMYIYSRECGRLVKHVGDARSELGLSAGGTTFCQGLTIVLDDFESSLPLTPTKQDIAYSDGPRGDIHQANVKAWLRALTTTYYNHYQTIFGSKGGLTKEVKSHSKSSRSMAISEDFVTPLRDYRYFNSFQGHSWARRMGRIAISKKQDAKVIYGDGTLMKFTCAVLPEPAPKKAKPARESIDSVSSLVEPGDRAAAVVAYMSHLSRRTNTGKISYSESTLTGNGSYPMGEQPMVRARSSSNATTPQSAGKRNRDEVSDISPKLKLKFQSELREQREQKELFESEVAQKEKELERGRSKTTKLFVRNEELLQIIEELRNGKMQAERDLEQLKISTMEKHMELERSLKLQIAESQGLKQELEEKNRKLLAYDEDSD